MVRLLLVLGALALAAVSSSPAAGQTLKAITQEGKTVILYPDGRWEYADAGAKRLDAQRYALALDRRTLATIAGQIVFYYYSRNRGQLPSDQLPSDKEAVLRLLTVKPRFHCAGNDFTYDPRSGHVRLRIEDPSRCSPTIEWDNLPARLRLIEDESTLAAMRSAIAIYYGRNNGEFPPNNEEVYRLLQPPGKPRFQCSGNDVEYDPKTGAVRLLIGDPSRC